MLVHVMKSALSFPGVIAPLQGKPGWNRFGLLVVKVTKLQTNILLHSLLGPFPLILLQAIKNKYKTNITAKY